MSIAKKYSADKKICKVTFTLPSSLAETAKTAHLVGEFNKWDIPGLQMKKRSGKFAIALDLKSNVEYQFRYLVDGERWETDWEADGLAQIPWSEGYNSVVKA